MKILLQAEIKDTSMSNVQKQIEDIQKKAKPIKVDIDTSGATKNMSQISRAIDDASKLERDWGKAIRMRGDEAHSAALKINKAMESEKNTTAALREQIELFKRRQEIQAKSIETKYKDTHDVEALARFRAELQTLDATSPKVQSQMKSMAVGLREIGAEARNGQVGVQSLGQSVMGAVQQFAMFAGVSLSVAGAVRSVKGGISTIVELDTAMVELKKVTDETDATYNQFVNTAFSLGKELSRTGQEAINATSSFARMGFSLMESTGLAREALLMLNVADGVDNLDDATSTIIAALKGFNIASEDSVEMARKINDSYNEVSNNFAINAGDIANGVKRSSAVLHQAGVSMDQTIGMLTGSFEVLQNMEKASSGIMVISQRLRGIGTDGEAIEGLAPKLGAAFDDIGIKLVGTNNELRSTYDILGDLAEIFPRLSSQQAAYISELTSGKRQSSVLQGLMSNWETVVNATETSMNSMGSSILENEKYIDSISGKIENFKSNVMSFWNTAINSEAVKDAIDFGSSFIGMLERVVGSFDGLQSVLGVIIPLVGIKLVFAFRSAYMEMVKLGAISGAKMLMSPASIGAVIKGMLGFTTVTQGATVAVGGLTLATGALTLGLGAIAFAFMKSAQKAKDAKEAMANALDNSQTLNAEIGDLDRLSKKQAELSSIENKSVEQKEELIKVQRELAQLYPELATGIDAEGVKIAENTEMTKELAEEKKKLLEQELLVLSSKANEELPRLRKELEEMQAEAEDIQRKLTSGDTKGVATYYDEYGQAIEIATDKTSKYQDRLLELVTAQQSHHNEIQNNESALSSYGEVVAENIEREKWARAEEIASQDVRSLSISQAISMQDELKALGFTSDEVSKIMTGNLAEVKESHNVLTEAQIENLIAIKDLDEATQIASINMLNKSRDLTIGYIADTKSRISAMQAEIRALSALSGASLVKRAPEQMPMPKFGDSVLDTMSGVARYELAQTSNELKTLESSLAKIDAALSNVSSIKTSGIVGGTSAKGKTKKPKKEKKKKEEYKAEADAYAEINLLLERNSTLLALNKTHQDQAGDDLSKKIRLMEEEIELRAQGQVLQHKLNIQQREERANLEKSLSKQGFTFSGEGDTRMIANLEKIEGKSKEVETQFNRYIALQKTEIPKASQEWANLQNAIDKIELDKLVAEFKLADKAFEDINKSISDLEYELKMLDLDDFNGKIDNNVKTLAKLKEEVEDTTKQLEALGENGFKEGTKQSDAFIARQVELTARLKEGTLAAKEYERSLVDMVRARAKEMIEAEKRNAYMDLELRQREANAQIKADRDRMDSNVKRKQNEIDSIQSEIDRIQESEKARSESLERSTRLEEISKLQNKYYHLQYVNLGNITEEQAKLVGLEKEREQYLERQTKLQELQLKLTNLQREKNIQQLTKKSDGTWEFEYVADQKAIDDVNKQVEDLQKEHNRTIKDLKEQTLNDLKNAQESYDEWERQNDIRRQIEAKQQRIAEYQDEIKDLQDKFAEKERLTNEAFALEKENLDRFYTDIDILTDEKMAELYETFDGNWLKISEMMTTHFNGIASEYRELIDLLSKPLPTPQAPGGGGTGSSGGRDSDFVGYAGGKTPNKTDSVTMVRPDGGVSSVNKDYVDKYLGKGYTVKHKGGVVGDGNRDLPEIANQLFNTKPNEQMVKALKGELFVPEENLSKYFLPNMQELLKDTTFDSSKFQKVLKSAVLSTMSITPPKLPNIQSASIGGGGITQQITVKEIVFPNVRDAREIESSVKSLSTYANQWANQK